MDNNYLGKAERAIVTRKKIFEVILESGTDVYKIYVPSKTKKDAESYVRGNGDVVRVREHQLVNPISIDKIVGALKTGGFGEMEVNLISRALSDCDFIE